MSAFIQDVTLKGLPKDVASVVARFTGAKKDTKFAHYGMTVGELTSKADPHNLKTARKHLAKTDPKRAARDVHQQIRKGTKYVLIQNDRIVDGHHHVAKAERGKVTSSLNVLDLTPARFQLAVIDGRILKFERPIGYEAGVPLTGRVGRDRYVKKVRDQDLDRRDANILRAGTAGALAGALTIRRGRILSRAALGGAAGAGGVLAVRAVTKNGRDAYGERSREGKQAETLPALASGAVAAGAVIRKARKFRLSANSPVITLEKKREINPAIKAGISAGLSGAALGLIPALKRGTGLRTVGKAVAAGAVTGATLVGGGTAVGSKVLGNPAPKEGAPITKRAALGSAILAAPLSIAGAVALHKTAGGRRLLLNTARKTKDPHWLSRPANLARKIGTLGTAAAAGVTVPIAVAAHAADEGQQVDTLNSLKRDRKQSFGFNSQGRLVIFASEDTKNRAIAIGSLAAGGGVAYAGIRAGRAAKAAEGTAREIQKSGRGIRRAVAAINRGGRIAKTQLTTFPTLKKMARRFRLSSGHEFLIEFGRSDQPRWRDSNRYADPVEGYARKQSFINSDRSEWKPSSPQVANAVWRKAKQTRVTVQRTGGLATDAVAHITGAPRQKDAAGRTKKREWEKSWFKNAVTTAGIAGTLGGGVLLRRYARTNPGSPTARVVKRTEARVRLGRAKAERFVGRSMDHVAGALGLESLERNIILFDAYAEHMGWDLRDARGKSARVFAPGSKRRVRRPAEWHEKKEGQRKILVGAGVAATVAAGAGAFAIGKRIGGKQAIKRALKVKSGGNIIPFPRSGQGA